MQLSIFKYVITIIIIIILFTQLQTLYLWLYIQQLWLLPIFLIIVIISCYYILHNCNLTLILDLILWIYILKCDFIFETLLLNSDMETGFHKYYLNHVLNMIFTLSDQ